MEVRRPAPAEREAVAAFVARCNALPAQRCLHCAETTRSGVISAMRASFQPNWERCFQIAVDNHGEVTGVLGCQTDAGATTAWLWGPWITSRAPGRLLLEAALANLPHPVRRADAFLASVNRAGLELLAANGFSLRAVTHIYVAAPANWQAEKMEATLPEPLRAAHEVAFTALHANSFPPDSATGEELLASRDDEHRIFAAVDGLRLLGYLCASVNPAPREGFIDYLAVKPAMRGRGIGGALLRRAMQWAFEERRLPQVALCVSDWRSGARKLYEHAGFSLSASGIGARRDLAGHR